MILLDTAPLLNTSDPIDIVPVADFVLVVARPGHTERDTAHQAMELLERHRVTVAGLLLTAVDPVGSEYYYSYSSYTSSASASAATSVDPALPVTAAAEATAEERKGKRHARKHRRIMETPADDV